MSLIQKAVLFDLGGVIVHYDPARSITCIAAVNDADPELIGIALQEISDQIGVGELGSVDLHRHLMEHAGVTADYQAFEVAFCAGIGRDEFAMGYVAALLEDPTLSLGIISNTVESHVRWLRTNLPELERFEAVVFSNEVGLLKPDDRIYRLALDRLALTSEQTLFVDDRFENVAAARELGMVAIQHLDWVATSKDIQAWLAGY